MILNATEYIKSEEFKSYVDSVISDSDYQLVFYTSNDISVFDKYDNVLLYKTDNDDEQTSAYIVVIRKEVKSTYDSDLKEHINVEDEYELECQRNATF